MAATPLALILLSFMVGMPVIANLLGVVLGLRLKRLLRDVPCIECADDLYQFKAEVRLQMYAALSGMVMIGLTLLTGFAGVFVCGPASLIVMVIAYSLYAVCTPWLLTIEKKVRMIPVANEEFQRERDHIVHVWRKKALPDW